jgi:CRISPR-associated protein Csb1
LNEQYDSWLAADGPVAVTITEPLEAVLGATGVISPPTFAPAQKGDVPAYVVDDTGDGKVALVDTVGSQANRLEPIFKQEPFSVLVPRAVIRIGAREVNILDAGHRAADALVRFSSHRDQVAAAFKELYDTGNAAKLGKLAPTSLIFGVWDSRGSGVKIPRLIGSTVRAFGVEELTRNAQFFSAFEKEETNLLAQSQDFLSEQGLSDAPAGLTRGGVIPRKGIVRESVMNLVALRAISAGELEETRKLQRYVLGLSLVALAAPWKSFLREGCLLVTVKGSKLKQEVVFRDGNRQTLVLEMKDVLPFAESAAKDFGVGPNWEAAFEPNAVTDLAKAKGKKSKPS